LYIIDANFEFFIYHIYSLEINLVSYVCILKYNKISAVNVMSAYSRRLQLKLQLKIIS